MDKKSNKKTECNKTASCCDKKKKGQWAKPLLKDVSGEIMAQPYIRFT